MRNIWQTASGRKLRTGSGPPYSTPGRTTGIVALELASGLLFSNLMSLEGIPEIMTRTITGASTNPILTMLLINVILVIAGMFLNPGFSNYRLYSSSPSSWAKRGLRFPAFRRDHGQ